MLLHKLSYIHTVWLHDALLKGARESLAMSAQQECITIGTVPCVIFKVHNTFFLYLCEK
jgi:hypothetical protein